MGGTSENCIIRPTQKVNAFQVLCPKCVLGAQMVLFAATLLLISNNVFATDPDTEIPKRFAFKIEHPPRITYSVELVDGELRYIRTWDEAAVKEKRLTKNASAADWFRFRTSLDDLNVWKWRTHYVAAKQFDKIDTKWSAVIEYSDKHISADGVNSYPGPENTQVDSIDKESGTFIALILAVRELVDPDAFSATESRKLANGYFLTIRDDDPNAIFLCHPNPYACWSITMIGWQKPYIVTNSEVIATGTGSIEQLEPGAAPSNFVARKIQTRPAKEAWKLLDGNKPLW